MSIRRPFYLLGLLVLLSACALSPQEREEKLKLRGRAKIYEIFQELSREYDWQEHRISLRYNPGFCQRDLNYDALLFGQWRRIYLLTAPEAGFENAQTQPRERFEASCLILPERHRSSQNQDFYQLQCRPLAP